MYINSVINVNNSLNNYGDIKNQIVLIKRLNNKNIINNGINNKKNRIVYNKYKK
jgi:hypothetical protein